MAGTANMYHQNVQPQANTNFAPASNANPNIPNNSQAMQTTPAGTMTQEPKKSSKAIWIWIAILVLILIGLGVYFWLF